MRAGFIPLVFIAMTVPAMAQQQPSMGDRAQAAVIASQVHNSDLATSIGQTNQAVQMMVAQAEADRREAAALAEWWGKYAAGAAAQIKSCEVK